MLKFAMRASTLATFDDVTTIPETVSPPWSTVLSMWSATICGGAFGASCGTEARGFARGVGVGVGCALAVGAALGANVTPGVGVGALVGAATGVDVEVSGPLAAVGVACAVALAVGATVGAAVGVAVGVGVGEGSSAGFCAEAHAVRARRSTRKVFGKRIASVTFVLGRSVPCQDARERLVSKGGPPCIKRPRRRRP